MFYLLYLYYADIAHQYPLLNLVQYQTVRMALALATAMIVAVAMGSRFINWIRAKQGRGQPIRDDGPVSHLSKVGTPTMGGLMILAGIGVAVLLWGDLTNPYIWIVSLVTAAFGVLGFIDDYAKVTKQTSAGLTSKQKLLAQTVVAVVAGALTVLWMTVSPTSPGLETSIAFPFFKAVLLNIGWCYVAFAAVTIVGFSNAVNLPAGLDGLATVPVMMAAGAFGVILVRQFFVSIDPAFEEAARIDGANAWQVFRRIMVPLAMPAVATLAVIAFLSSWNDFLWPVFVLFSTDMLTLPAGLAQLQGEYASRYDLLMAGAVIASVPVLLVYVFAQRYVIDGVSQGGVKG